MTANVQWPVWSATARLLVTEPAALPEARVLTERLLAAIDLACSRFRPDSELARHPAGAPAPVSPLLAELVRTALSAAEASDGAVDPTVGGAMAALGYDRDIAEIRVDDRDLPVTVVPGWQHVMLTGTTLTIPHGITLDLGATAKAYAAHRCATDIAVKLRTGVLVNLGGDIATAGPGPHGGWQILVQDTENDEPCTISLPAGAAIATSSTVRRTWRRGGRLLHHVLDPATGLPAARTWRSVSVVADRCVDANTLSTATLVRGPAMVRAHGVPARLVAANGSISTLGGWP
ncbi:FAD:protein FMN transferase [Kutzneria viridogrisea]|uniref:FAD:protein FMN transferase n=1 Tax=Kutzneria viridogrisea TaxID=47990 RepID=A0ABR6BMQ6_9PSEU|nr:thiamine biosynthesis lipoprotein [Kutzneria viridogrisea]